MSGLPTGLQISADIIHQPVQDEVVLLNLKTQQYFSLDDVGARMWNLLVEHNDVAVVSEILVKEYQVEPGRLRADLQSLVGELAEAGIVLIDHK